jgi:hypothetical protein
VGEQDQDSELTSKSKKSRVKNFDPQEVSFLRAGLREREGGNCGPLKGLLQGQSEWKRRQT